MRVSTTVLLCAAFWTSGLVSGFPARGDSASVLTAHADAIVRVEAVLRTKFNVGGQGDERDSRIDLNGAVVSPDGLVMVWNSRISSARMTELMALAGPASGFSVDITPIDFKVFLTNPRREVRAFLVATESNLDLAFIQLESIPEEPLGYVNFQASGEPAVGDEIVAITRLGRKFDDAPFVQTARIGGWLEKPRKALILDGSLASFGLPVFDTNGRPVGALTTIVSHVVDDGGDAHASFGQMMSSLLGPAAGTGPLGAFVLPGDRVHSLIERAEARAIELRQRAERDRAE